MTDLWGEFEIYGANLRNRTLGSRLWLSALALGFRLSALGSRLSCGRNCRILMVRLLRLFIVGLLLAGGVCSAQPRRKIIIDQDCSGPGGSNLQTLLILLQSREVEVLGITVVSGDQWRDEEVAHTLRLLEI